MAASNSTRTKEEHYVPNCLQGTKGDTEELITGDIPEMSPTVPIIRVKKEPEDCDDSDCPTLGCGASNTELITDGSCHSFPFTGNITSANGGFGRAASDPSSSGSCSLSLGENDSVPGEDSIGSSTATCKRETNGLLPTDDWPVKCCMCSLVFYKAWHLRAHLRTHAGKEFVCDTCLSTLSLTLPLISHVWKHAEGSLQKCAICSSVFVTKSFLDSCTVHHEASPDHAHGLGCVKSPNCPAKPLPEHHIKAAQNYECDPATEFVPSTASDPGGRSEAPASKRRHKCEFCPSAFAFAGQLKTHMLVHTGEKPHKCSLCSAAFCRKSQLVYHTRTHNAEKPHKCDLCPAEFVRPANLRSHLRTHTKEKPYKCELCSIAYSQCVDLKRHMLKHTGEKPYACQFCPAAFARSARLADHLRTHTGERPYRCEVCDATFSYARQLKAHVESHTGEKPHKCRLCPAQFSQSTNLKRHMQVHVGEKQHKCQLCPTAFTQLSHLKRHVKMHGDDKPCARGEAESEASPECSRA